MDFKTLFNEKVKTIQNLKRITLDLKAQIDTLEVEAKVLAQTILDYDQTLMKLEKFKHD